LLQELRLLHARHATREASMCSGTVCWAPTEPCCGSCRLLVVSTQAAVGWGACRANATVRCCCAALARFVAALTAAVDPLDNQRAVAVRPGELLVHAVHSC
jgi:hypothetical protein